MFISRSLQQCTYEPHPQAPIPLLIPSLATSMSVFLHGGRGGSVLGKDSGSQTGISGLGVKNNVSEKDEVQPVRTKSANNCSWATEREDLDVQPWVPGTLVPTRDSHHTFLSAKNDRVEMSPQRTLVYKNQQYVATPTTREAGRKLWEDVPTVSTAQCHRHGGQWTYLETSKAPGPVSITATCVTSLEPAPERTVYLSNFSNYRWNNTGKIEVLHFLGKKLPFKIYFSSSSNEAESIGSVLQNSQWSMNMHRNGHQ